MMTYLKNGRRVGRSDRSDATQIEQLIEAWRKRREARKNARVQCDLELAAADMEFIHSCRSIMGGDK